MSENKTSGCLGLGCVAIFAIGILSALVNLSWSIVDSKGYEAYQQERRAEEKAKSDERAKEDASKAIERADRDKEREAERAERAKEREQDRQRRQRQIDAARSAEIERSEFLQIQPGMSYFDVALLIGSDGELVSDVFVTGSRIQSFRWQQNRGAGVAVVDFENGVAYSKSQDGLE